MGDIGAGSRQMAQDRQAREGGWGPELGWGQADRREETDAGADQRVAGAEEVDKFSACEIRSKLACGRGKTKGLEVSSGTTRTDGWGAGPGPAASLHMCTCVCVCAALDSPHLHSDFAAAFCPSEERIMNGQPGVSFWLCQALAGSLLCFFYSGACSLIFQVSLLTARAFVSTSGMEMGWGLVRCRRGQMCGCSWTNCRNSFKVTTDSIVMGMSHVRDSPWHVIVNSLVMGTSRYTWPPPYMWQVTASTLSCPNICGCYPFGGHMLILVPIMSLVGIFQPSAASLPVRVVGDTFFSSIVWALSQFKSLLLDVA